MSDPGGALGVYAGGNITTAGAQIVSGGSVEMTAKGGDITTRAATSSAGNVLSLDAGGVSTGVRLDNRLLDSTA